MKIKLLYNFSLFVLLLVPNLNFGQAPNLGSTAGFALFTAAGEFASGGLTVVEGDVGTHVGAFSGFPPGIVNGQIYLHDAVSAQAALDVESAFMDLSALTCGPVLGVTLGNGQTITPNIYCIGSAATLEGNLTLDGQCNPDAIFIIKINGAFESGVGSQVLLINSASLCNVYWQINGAVSLGVNSVFRGTIVANGAISLYEGASLFGRGLTREGAIALHNNMVNSDMQPSPSVITAGGATTFCAGGSVVLSSNCGGTWSNGETTPTIVVTTSGDYFVTTSNSCGSAISNHFIVTVIPPPVCTITGNNFFCAGGSTVLCTPPGAASYLWSTGANTNCINVATAGNYSVTVTDADGCSSVCRTSVTETQSPVCTITGNNFFCAGGSTVLCTPPGAASYLWSTGANTNCINVATAGNYSVTVTYAGGCSSVCSVLVTETQSPVCTITGNNFFCAGGSTVLCTPPGAASYLWSTGANTNCINVATAGNYSVTVTYADGCSSVCSVLVTETQSPVCTITGNNFFCAGGSTELCTPPGAASYLWSTGANTNCINVATAGNYSVTVTYANGCSSVCSVLVTENPPPACTITGNNFFCAGGSTELCTPPGAASYLWSTGANTNCINVAMAGNYSVTVTYANGCSSVCSVLVTENPPLTCTITGNNFFCAGGSTELCTPPGAASYLWSTGANTNCINVAMAGNYSVTVTYAGGCSSVCSVLVTENQSPVCTITGNNFFCAGGSTVLCTPPGAASYLWSTGANTNCINVAMAGNYSVTVTYAGGCSSVCSVLVTENQSPVCTITGNNFFCAGGSTELCTPPGAASYLWSTGANTNCINVATAGNYSVTVTYANGCSSVCSVLVTENPPLTCTITGNNFFCTGGSTELCTPPGAASYLWSTGANTNCINVATAGNYSVTVTYANGCSSVCSVLVTENPPLACTITGNNFFCAGGSTELCTPPGAASYLWSTGANTNCINVAMAGNYSVTVTYAGGCSSVCSVLVTENQSPVCTITGNNFFCAGGSTQLCTPPGAASYLWSTGANTNCINVAMAGNYSVTVTYANGCSSVCSVLVTENQSPACTITGNNFFCTGGSTELCTPPGAASYLWSTGANTNCINVATAGNYSVTVTYANGCSSVCSVLVTENPPLTCTITGNNFFCTGGSTELCTPPGAASYLWSTGANTNCINVATAGNYSVTVTYANGCSSVCSVLVTENPPLACTITGNNFFCAGGSTQLCTPPGAASYLWSTGANTNCINVAMAGNYSVTVTYADGCSSVCSVLVTENPPPACTITGDDCICNGQPIQLCAAATNASTFLWSTRETTSCIFVTKASTYSVTITDADGCSSVCSKTITSTLAPVITCPANVTVDCDDSILPPNTGTAIATNNCDLVPTISYYDTNMGSFYRDTFSIARTWTAINACGDSSSCIQILSVIDTVPPLVECPVGITVPCADQVPPIDVSSVVTSDNCGGMVTVIHIGDVISDQNCLNNFTLTRTYMATDAYGNTTICSQIITVLDNTPPEIMFTDTLLLNGDTLWVECFGQDPEWNLPYFNEGSVLAEDFCDGAVTVDFNKYQLGNGTCEDGFINMYRLSWIAYDNCGNTDSVFIFLALIDTIPPVIYGVPEDITVNCNEIPPFPDNIYATDECLCACIIFEEESGLIDGCQNGQVIVRSWTAKDDCGNQTTVTQTITLIDDTAPALLFLHPEMASITNGTVLNYRCSEGGIPAIFEESNIVFALDTGICGSSSTLTFDMDILLADNCEALGFVEQRTYTWVATDECGNMSTMSFIVRLTDTEAPVFTGVPDTACLVSPWLNNVVVTDDCGQITMQFQDFNIPNPCGSGMAVQRIYEASDNCGNTSRDTSILIPNDSTALSIEFTNPVLAAVETGDTLTLNCKGQNGHYTDFGIEDVRVEDACVGLNLTFSEVLVAPGDCLANGLIATLELRWTATDICGNSIERVIIAHIVDNTAPVFVDFLPELSIGCNDELPTLRAMDNCGYATVQTTWDSIILSSCVFKYEMQRLVTATDACGNTATQMQIIHVGNGAGPVFEGIVEVVCNDATSPVVTALDACSGQLVEVAMQADTLDSPCGGMIIERTWTATDSCGNTSTSLQTVIINDTVPPVLIVPVNSFLSSFLAHRYNPIYLSQSDKLYDLDRLNSGSVLMVGDCDEAISIQFSADILKMENCLDSGYIERRTYTWTATDFCGNTAIVSFVVDIFDDVPPVFVTVPANMTIVCEDLPVVPLLHTDDLTPPVTIAFSETIVPGARPGVFIVTRTWTATDACNNVTVYTQTITWIPDTFLECAINVPDLVECNTHGVLICSENQGSSFGSSFHWEIIGEECFIQGSPNTECIYIYVGWSPVEIILTVTDRFGCVTTCTETLDCQFVFSNSFYTTPSGIAPALGTQTDANTFGNIPANHLQNLYLYPNPAVGSVNLRFESLLEDEVEFRMMNVLGGLVSQTKIIAQKGVNTHQMDVSNLPEGSYMMQVKTGEETHTKVIVVMLND